MNRCLLPQSEQAELRAGVSLAQADYDEAKSRLRLSILNVSPSMTKAQLDMIELRIDAFESALIDLVSSQNIAIKAGLTAEGERWEK